MSREKNIQEIQEKIQNRRAVVLTASEMKMYIREKGVAEAAKKVDVVTTGTFGAMCSSGVFMNFGHNDPPLKMERISLNGVKAYGGIAAVDAYLGVTEQSKSRGSSYGGAHVIDDLIRHRPVLLKAKGNATDCYPGKRLKTWIELKNLNQAIMLNPRNAYQRYNAATNSGNKTLNTYMGRLLPRLRNVTYSGAGEISPINNDPHFNSMGIGTRIFLGGAQGYIVGPGTQHSPGTGFATLMVSGDLKTMRSEFIRPSVFKGYGCTLFIGIGIPILILNEEIAYQTAVSNNEIMVNIVDYSVPSRQRPIIKSDISYTELQSGSVELNGKKVPTGSISSLYMAQIICKELKQQILSGEFLPTSASAPIETESLARPLHINSAPDRKTKEIEKSLKLVKDIALYCERCIRCGLCATLCPAKAITHKKDELPQIDQGQCRHCYACFKFCPIECYHSPQS